MSIWFIFRILVQSGQSGHFEDDKDFKKVLVISRIVRLKVMQGSLGFEIQLAFQGFHQLVETCTHVCLQGLYQIVSNLKQQITPQYQMQVVEAYKFAFRDFAT